MLYEQWQQLWQKSVRRVLVWGAGGHSREVQAALKALHVHPVVKSNHEQDGSAVYVPADEIQNLQPQVDGVIVAIGDHVLRRHWCQQLHKLGFRLLTVVHPAASVVPNAVLGDGTYVAAGAVVQPCLIGHGVIINSLALVSHDCFVDDYSHIAPGARLLGGATVRRECRVFAGAVLAPNADLGVGCTVAAQSFVRENWPAGCLLAGSPAKIVRGPYDTSASTVLTPERANSGSAQAECEGPRYRGSWPSQDSGVHAGSDAKERRSAGKRRA